MTKTKYVEQSDDDDVSVSSGSEQSSEAVDSSSSSDEETGTSSGKGNLPPISSKSSSKIPRAPKAPEGALSKQKLIPRSFTAIAYPHLAADGSLELVWSPRNDDMFKSRIDEMRGSARFGDLRKVLVAFLGIKKYSNLSPYDVFVSIPGITEGNVYANSHDGRQLTRGAYLMLTMDKEKFGKDPYSIYRPPSLNKQIVNHFADKISLVTEGTEIVKGEGNKKRVVYVVPTDHVWAPIIETAMSRDADELGIVIVDGNYEIPPNPYKKIKSLYEKEVLAKIPRQSLSKDDLKVVFQRADGRRWNDPKGIPLFTGADSASQTLAQGLADKQFRILVEFSIEYFIFDLKKKA